MKNFIFYAIKSVQEYCRTFSCRLNVGFSSLNFKTSVNRLLRFNCWQQSFALLLVLAILMTGFTANAQNILGTAPVIAPKGGFAVDGNAFVKFPGDDQSAGDFLFENQSALITADPGGIFVPMPPPYDYPDGPLPASFYVYPNTTFFRDNITNNDPTIFTGSNKINDAVSSYTWGAGSSPNKNEIQNAIAHFTFGDPALGGVATDLWMIFAADRQVTEGSSYIDFEILQKRLTMEPNGTFSSEAGTPSGRTVGDLLVTIEFTQGGDFANVVVRRWSGTAYVEFTPDPGTVYGTNNTGQTIVPYPIYNQDPISTNPDLWAYEANQWAEGAVNVTSFFGNDPCFVISTLFVRTRTSGSSGQSELKDFPGAPFQLDLNLTPNAPTTTSAAICGSSGVVNLSASGCAGGTLKWFDAAVGGNQVATGPTFSPNISQTTSYWVSCTSATGCEGPRAQVTGTVNPNPTAAAGPDQAKCQTAPSGPTSFTLAGTATNGTAVWSVFASTGTAVATINNTASLTSTVSVAGIGTVTLRLTSTSNATPSCGTATDDVVLTVNANPTAGAGPDQAKCQTAPSGPTSFTLAGTATNGTAIWSVFASTGTAVATINNTASLTSTVSVAGAGTVTLRLSTTSNATPSCGTATDDVVLTVNANPVLVITNPATVCEGETVDLTAAAVTSGSTLQGGVLSYWTNAEATIALATPSAVMAGTYYIKALTTAGCMDVEPVMVTDQPCGGPLCTYTQGYYGNLGGMSCAEGEQYTAIGLIEKALASYGGTMVVGSGGNTVSISSATCVIDVLPGGGGSYVLSGAHNICSLPSSYLKKGTLNNTLLAQTITLGLNLGIDSQLGDFVLQSGILATAAPEGGCGSDTPMPRSCSAEGFVPVINEFQYFTIPAVVDLLPVKTVQGLYDMANIALGGGVLPQGVTLSALANAIDVINNAFDGCRISMGYDQTPLVCDSSDPQGFVAFEVPIVNDQLTIKYKFSYVSDVTIDVFDTSGNKVYSKADTNSYLDKEVVLNHDFNTGTQKVYIVRLTTKLGSSEQKVISSN